MTPVRPDEPPTPESTIAWVKDTFPRDHIGAALFGLGRIAEALEHIATELRLRNRAQGIFPE